MIYLIDDKKNRQKDFGWSEDKLAEYSSFLTPLYNLGDIARVGEALYSDESVILYHESFLDFTPDRSKAVDQRNKLVERASNNEITVAFFSGSQSSKSLSENAAYLPVSVLYQNLELFINHYNRESVDLKYLLFGQSPEIEEELEEKRAKANRDIEDKAAEIPGKNLFIRPKRRFIPDAIKGAKEESITSNDISDEKLSEKINEWLTETEFDNIFIPLCFGQTLSDFNGLRLACHIRCTSTSNQLKNIFIYGFVGIEYLLENEYFNILKTRNVQLIEHKKEAIQAAGNNCHVSLSSQDLSVELRKLNLPTPKNYYDSHSIANEWGIYQMARNGNINVNDLNNFDTSKFESIYFKWLIAKNELNIQLPNDQILKQKRYSENLPGLTLITKIDLDKIPK
jgi:hypothetical protein